MMASNVFINMEVDVSGVNGLPANHYLPQAWGFSAIRRIVMVYGGSEQLEITGAANFERAMSEAETDRKKTALLNLAGELIGRSGGEGALVGRTARACVPIYLPHSSVNAMSQIPFDCGLLTQNVVIRLDLETADKIYATRSVAGALVPLAITSQLNTIAKGGWYVKQLDMIDTSASKADRVGPNGPSLYNFFYYHPQTFESSTLKITGPLDLDQGSAKQNITLNGFRNGSLQSIVFWVERLKSNYDLNANAANSSQYSYGRFEELLDISLDFGGSCVYHVDSDKAALLLDLVSNHTDGTIDSQKYKYGAGTTADLNDTTVGRSPYYRVQISQFSEVFRDYIQTGANVSSDTMQLGFRIKGKTNHTTGALEYQFKLTAMYIYQAAVAVQKGGGSFMFSNPLPSPNPISLPMA